MRTPEGRESEWAEDVAHWLRQRKYQDVAEAAGCSVDAAMLAWDALSCANANNLLSTNAGDVCNIVRDFAEGYFACASDARELLGEWGIRRSEDLGRIIYAFVDAGRLKAEGESVEDFAGLFVLDTWLSDDQR